jgi:hypothetical protein
MLTVRSFTPTFSIKAPGWNGWRRGPFPFTAHSLSGAVFSAVGHFGRRNAGLPLSGAAFDIGCHWNSITFFRRAEILQLREKNAAGAERFPEGCV